MRVSPDTLLRLIRRAPDAETPTPTVLGVDDWAIHKGLTYGTILMDLERHRPVDVLPDRSSESFAAWLKAHPGVAIVARDRGGAFADLAALQDVLAARCRRLRADRRTVKAHTRFRWWPRERRRSERK
jgi:hypothetical protein